MLKKSHLTFLFFISLNLFLSCDNSSGDRSSDENSIPIESGADENSNWTTQEFGVPGNDSAKGVVVDKNNNTYVVGEVRGSLDDQSFAGGWTDIFVKKYNESGDRIWTKLYGIYGSDSASAVQVDNDGDIYITGYTTGPGKLDGVTNPGTHAIFVMKIKSDGTKKWTTMVATSGSQMAYDLALDSSNNIYITGYTEESLDDISSHQGSKDGFLIKFNENGAQLWNRLFGTSSQDIAKSIAIDSESNLYMTGLTQSGMDDHVYGGRYGDIFLIKYSNKGDKIWTKQLGETGSEQGLDITIDEENNIYLTGYTDGPLNGTTDTSGEVADIILVKYNKSGDRLFTKRYSTPYSDIGRSIKVSGDYLYIAGSTSGSLDGISSSGNSDLFLMKTYLNGDKIWVKQYDGGKDAMAFDLALDSYNNIYVSGRSNYVNDLDCIVLKYNESGILK